MNKIIKNKEPKTSDLALQTTKQIQKNSFIIDVLPDQV